MWRQGTRAFLFHLLFFFSPRLFFLNSSFLTLEDCARVSVSRDEPNRHRIAPSQMPVHQGHQGKWSLRQPFAHRSHQLLRFYSIFWFRGRGGGGEKNSASAAAPRLLWNFSVACGMRIDARHFGDGCGECRHPQLCAAGAAVWRWLVYK